MLLSLSSPRRAARALAVIALMVTGLSASRTADPSAPANGAAPFHAHLTKSAPAKDDTLATSPRVLQLWFSETVELPVSRVTLSGAGATAVALGAPAYVGGPSVEAPVELAVKTPLAAGTYTVNWSVAAKDGHPSKGTYEFVVRAGR